MSQLAILSDLATMGVSFGLSKHGEKRPMGKDWQRRPRSFMAASRHFKTGGNVGMLPGRRSAGVVVVDFDADADRLRNHPLFGRTRKVTRSDAPERVKALVRVVDRLPANRKAHDAGVELLSSGSYAVLAGTHPDGAAYEIDEAPVLAVTFAQLADAWQGWTGGELEAAGLSGDVVLPGTTAEELLDAALVAGLPGSRNRAGFELARRLRDLGYGENVAGGLLLTYQIAVEKTGDHEYTQREALATLRAVYKHRARRSHVDVVLDGLEAAVIFGEITLPANARKTMVGVIAVMRSAGKIDDVGLSLRQLATLTGVPRSTIADHLGDLVDRFDLLVQTRRGNYTRSSEYALSDKSRHCAKFGHPKELGATPTGGVRIWHNVENADLETLRDGYHANAPDWRQAIDVYRSLQTHPMTAPGARMHPQLAEDEEQAAWSFGAGSQAILAALAAGGVPNVETLADAAKLSKRTAYRRLATLLEAGLVARHDGCYQLAGGWAERADEIAPALTTYGRLELRAWMGAKVALKLHGRMTRQRNGENRRIAEHSADRAEMELTFWEAQKDERNRERFDYGRRLGLADADIPSISLTVGQAEKRVRQPWKVWKEGRKVIPENPGVHVGKGGITGHEELRRLLAKGLLLKDEAERVCELASQLGVDVQLEVIQLQDN